eukprot:TRINITY_DN2766_c0_g1_i9.p2 TRINITY_DN2766_c0_g1~~TRINITY_DN2766_c0_g1_i9.p2  ORF type:complete len:228 (+),score=23.54 TRINITY_DN2766_c0_g1_i9:193-876(+)
MHPCASKAKSSKFTELTHRDRVLVTKLTRTLNTICQRGRPDVEALFEAMNDKHRDLLFPITKKLLITQTMNNYRLIRFHGQNPEQGKDERQLEYRDTARFQDVIRNFGDFTSLEWKIEMVLSSNLMKRVMRPRILLIFHTKQGGRRSVYLDVAQFQDFRKNVCLMIKQIHQLENIPNQLGDTLIDWIPICCLPVDCKFAQSIDGFAYGFLDYWQTKKECTISKLTLL